MNKRVVFRHENGDIGILIPGKALLDINEVARKDVPAGLPYVIVDADELPEERTNRALWSVEFEEPDGHGIGGFAWFKEQFVKSAGTLLFDHAPQPGISSHHDDLRRAVNGAIDMVMELPDAGETPEEAKILYRSAPDTVSTALAEFTVVIKSVEAEIARAAKEERIAAEKEAAQSRDAALMAELQARSDEEAVARAKAEEGREAALADALAAEREAAAARDGSEKSDA